VPLPLVFCKKSERGCTDSLRVERRILDATRGTDMSSDIFHGSAMDPIAQTERIIQPGDLQMQTITARQQRQRRSQ
jgi:hypothetical protein